MTDNDINRLWEHLKTMSEKIEDLSIATALNTKSVKDIPEKISNALVRMELKYATIIIGGFVFVTWFMVQIALPKLVQSALPEIVTKYTGG